MRENKEKKPMDIRMWNNIIKVILNSSLRPLYYNLDSNTCFYKAGHEDLPKRG